MLTSLVSLILLVFLFAQLSLDQVFVVVVKKPGAAAQ